MPEIVTHRTRQRSPKHHLDKPTQRLRFIDRRVKENSLDRCIRCFHECDLDLGRLDQLAGHRGDSESTINIHRLVGILQRFQRFE